MEKFCKVYVQQYKYKAKITIELDLNARKVKGFYKAYRLYVKKYRELDSIGELISKASIQYNDRHVLQLQVTDIKYCQTMFDKFAELEWCEIIHINKGE